MRLARVSLRVRSPDTLAGFYTTYLGMRARREGHAVVLGYDGEDAAIELCQASLDMRYAHANSDRYWKIGITLPNVDIAAAQLRQAGIAISDPKQFNDIGYMCHLQDPEGFSIELLQQSFLGNRGGEEGDLEKILGGGARIGQITLRVSDLEKALGYYRDRLGMTLLSIQPVDGFGFTLHFLAFTNERPPDTDLEAVENREWLWKRPYTTLELQSFNGRGDAFGLPAGNEPGFAGIVISGSPLSDAPLHDEAGGRVYLTE